MNPSGLTVPDKKKPKKPARDRFDLRIDPALLARVQIQAERLGMNPSVYIRAAITRTVERDEKEQREVSD